MEPKEGINESLPQPENEGKGVEKGTEVSAPVESQPSRQKPATLPQVPQDMPTAHPVQLPGTSDDDSKAVVSEVSKEKVAEKQWVERAKQIIGETRDDPFKQNHEMSKAKAKYIKQKFNKTIRTDTGTA